MRSIFVFLLMASIATAQVCNVSNLVSNGDFESGYANIGSDYSSCGVVVCSDPLWEGQYVITSDAVTVHSAFQGTGNSGTGNLMAVNGAGTPNTIVWTQTITNVKPNTKYRFDAFVSTLSDTYNNISRTASLQFSINGLPIGPIFNSPLDLFKWDEFFTLWDSGTNTSAVITIINQNNSPDGNDFGLDDISFIEDCAYTPLSIITFNASSVQGQGINMVQWNCVKGQAHKYVLEKSSNSYQYSPVFTSIKEVDRFEDDGDPEQKLVYYRLKVLSEKGTVVAMSNVVQATNTSLQDIQTIYNDIGILFQSSTVPIKSIEVFGLDGVLWLASSGFEEEEERLIIPKSLIRSPMFYCRINAANETFVRKMGWGE
jgi:hypothetical protein